jgi:AcrR family transcriptional regulator
MVYEICNAFAEQDLSVYRLDGIVIQMCPMPQVADSVSVRERLLDAAEKVVARDGVANLTLDAVAREGGVSKGGLLYHFPSKSALITSVVERLAVQCDADHANAIAAAGEGPGAFTRAYLAARSEPLAPEAEPIHTALLAAAGTDSQYLEPFRKRLAQWQARLESDGIDPVTATIVRLAIDGLCLGALLRVPVPTGELRNKVVDRLRAMTHSPCGAALKTEGTNS